MRAVIDTNVVISGFLSRVGAPAQVLEQWRQGAFDLLVSPIILAEYAEVFGYERLQPRLRMSRDEIVEAIARFRKLGLLIEPAERLAVVQDDPDDNTFLDCAVAGRADVIVSGDRHLLALQAYGGIPVLSPATFLMLLEEAKP